MLFKTKKLFLGVALGALAACAQTPEPIGVDPTYDKYGNVYCPAGYVLSGDVCMPTQQATSQAGNGSTTGATDGDDADDGGNQQGNTNQNQTSNNNQNTNQSQSQNSGE